MTFAVMEKGGKKLIKLHFYHSGEEVFVLTRQICAVYRDQRKEYRDITVVHLSGGEENYMHVKETVDEVIEKIDKAERRENDAERREEE